MRRWQIITRRHSIAAWPKILSVSGITQFCRNSAKHNIFWHNSAFCLSVCLCSELSSLSRTTNPLHAMDALKSDYPQICVFPSTQNRDERIFSLVAQNTRPQCWRIKVDTIENKVLIGSDIQSHGFIINYKDGNNSSSDEES